MEEIEDKEKIITLNYQQSTIVIKAFNAVIQMGYEEKNLYLGDFKESANQVYIQIIDDLSGDCIDITLTRKEKQNAPTN